MPHGMGQFGNFGVSKCQDSVPNCRRLRVTMRARGMLMNLPGMFLSRQMILFSVMFGCIVGVHARIFQFSRHGMVFVV